MSKSVDSLVFDAQTSDGTRDVGELFYRSDLDRLRFKTGAALADSGGFDNLAASGPPVIGDDVNDGYEVGSYWIDTTNDVVWLCLDASAGAAIWHPVTPYSLEASATGATTVTSTTFGDLSGMVIDIPFGGQWVVSFTANVRTNGSGDNAHFRLQTENNTERFFVRGNNDMRGNVAVDYDFTVAGTVDLKAQVRVDTSGDSIVVDERILVVTLIGAEGV